MSQAMDFACLLCLLDLALGHVTFTRKGTELLEVRKSWHMNSRGAAMEGRNQMLWHDQYLEYYVKSRVGLSRTMEQRSTTPRQTWMTGTSCHSREDLIDVLE